MRLAGLLRVGLVIAAVVTLAGCGEAESGTKTTAAAKAPPLAGVEEIQALFDGIPQDGLVLGDPKAKVTFLEVIDPQCPFCKLFSEATLPTLVKDFVRTGKVRYETWTLGALGPDSERAARFLGAAGRQDKQANATELIYRNQGQENSGYMTDAFLRRVGHAIPGFDTERAMRDMRTPQAKEPLGSARSLALRYNVTGTPTLIVGPTGGDLHRVEAKAFDQVDAYRDAVQHAVDQAD